jgi:hypothetical protein
VTWTGEISRIVQARCVSCHSADGRAPMSLVTYAEARPWARAIKEEVQTRRMPKWHAVRGYGDFAGDPSLSPFEIALIAAWADGGAPKGASVSASFSQRPAHPRPARAAGAPLLLHCGTQPISGRLLAIRPVLQQGASAHITAQLPDGRREILAWIRNFDPEFAETYWLRRPLDLPPGSRLSTVADGSCSITIRLR